MSEGPRDPALEPLSPRPSTIASKHPDVDHHEKGTADDEITAIIESLPTWKDQLTVRGALIGAGLGAVFCIVVHKLMLTAGLFPTFNTAAGLLSFVFLKASSAFTTKLGIKQPVLGAQENTVVQTFIIACCNIAFSGGFSLQLNALSYSTYKILDMPGDNPKATFEPTMSKTIPLLICISVIGVFTVVFLRKLFIIDYQLPYPSGAATGVLINGFYTPSGEDVAKRQIRVLGKWFSVSFLWGFFKWFFGGKHCPICSTPGSSCGGFSSFPTFGLTAYKWSWNFDFQINLIGTGMICSHAVDWSMMLGAIISWGVLWPYIDGKAGEEGWYPAGTPQSSMSGLYGYKIFITLAIFMSDGLYNIVKVLLLSGLHMRAKQAEI
eukprot:CAMPEP_0202916382 /NCGR_PEP_ID=MMETSP1392-20130828/68467_1 /ASSEMBLY_ACC=CAM_ASM_000868 /TAXON_ID=225041 /ORGANISM="Chlamydomonas chlamydogama, Strain SAG 11-48b" /LENGTH=378 /DNA_ID=CAMNT_0049608799 /DNA_START=12 /DNA_END=1145 /DNA_ORIENTATION=+